ncbi:hypothetical protein BRPE64_ACDS09080 [Caballeronia insecticola]|uniref:Uncharacterized protein n=1 Tax=Caballeronia insecticola TaxID=758793 RepID=R4WXD7_9BURK|nr:hypothetical protein BRPE64_ACDS09080 [Caballeronia insecticola]
MRRRAPDLHARRGLGKKSGTRDAPGEARVIRIPAEATPRMLSGRILPQSFDMSRKRGRP